MKSTITPLPEILAKKLTAIHLICRRYHVKYLWVFGSVLEEAFSKDSDIDFLYEFDGAALQQGKYLPNLDGLIEGMIAIFPTRKIDLVDYQSLRNPYFIRSIEATKILLYAQRPEEIPV
ncbi:MAG: nucleotidyltransferase domain-containing protein [Bacteroidia bacterium]|nr:nucleotidyltransferase domain-containing protein [Bacteroidia bacterium]